MLLVYGLLADAQNPCDSFPRPACRISVLDLRSLEHLEQTPQSDHRLEALLRIPGFPHLRFRIFVDASTIVDGGSLVNLC
jgi:hypothetical protein